jgi:hypothetical protein
MEAFHMRILRGLAGLDMDQLDLPLDTPSQKMATGQFGAVVAANGPWYSALLDDLIQHACNAPAGEAGIHFQRETLARKCIDHAQHPDRSTCRDRIMHKILGDQLFTSSYTSATALLYGDSAQGI